MFTKHLLLSIDIQSIKEQKTHKKTNNFLQNLHIYKKNSNFAAGFLDIYGHQKKP